MPSELPVFVSRTSWGERPALAGEDVAGSSKPAVGAPSVSTDAPIEVSSGVASAMTGHGAGGPVILKCATGTVGKPGAAPPVRGKSLVHSVNTPVALLGKVTTASMRSPGSSSTSPSSNFQLNPLASTPPSTTP